MATSSWAPTVDDVGAWVRSRTKDRNGNELGTFNEDTRPTNTQVVRLIDDQLNDLADVIGEDIDQSLWKRARAVAALGSAMSVELSFFPEQVAGGRSPYAEMKTLYDERLARLVASIASGGGDDDAAGAMGPSISNGTGLTTQASPFAAAVDRSTRSTGWDSEY